MGFGDLPLRALIKITAGGTVYTLGEEVQSVSVSLKAGREAEEFQIVLKDEDQVYLNRYIEGCKTEIWIDKNNPPTTKRLTGIIEAQEINEPIYGRDILILKGCDYFSERAKNLLVAESYRDKEISLIVKALLNKYLPNITTNNVQTTNVTLSDPRFPYRYLAEAIEQLANICNYEYFCDETLDFHFFPKKAISSDLALTESEIVGTPQVSGDISVVKNIVKLRGPGELTVDQKQETATTGLLLNDYYRAVPFTPLQFSLEQISLYIEKVGNPPDPLRGEIREDKVNTPLGATVKSFEYSKEYVGSAGWYPLGVTEEIISGKKYWIVLKKQGDVSNTYRWYHDNGATGENAYSPDDVTWTRQTSSFTFTFKTYYSVPILAQAEDSISADKYEKREYFHSDPAILSRQTARKIAQALINTMRTRRREIGFEVLAPDIIPQVGSLVAVNYPALGISNEGLVLQAVIFNIQPHLTTYTIGMQFETALENVADVIANILGDVKMLKAQTSGVDETTLLDIYHLFEEAFALSDVLTRKTARQLAEALGLSDVLSCTEQATGTFKIGTAKIEFMNVGEG